MLTHSLQYMNILHSGHMLLRQGEGRALGCAGVAVGAGVCQQGPEQESSGDSRPRRTR